MTEHTFDEVWPGTAEEYQDYILPLVSRTFALTIPQLPEPLRRSVGNAYLLCRVADTIEDDVALSLDQKRRYEESLANVVSGPFATMHAAERMVEELAPLLSPQTPKSERELLRQLPLVLQVTRGFSAVQRAAIERCLRFMCRGMHHFQRDAGVHGLDTQRDMDRYCYYVAGIVGEMLTELFCDYSPEIAGKHASLQQLAASFGQGLQMTNILKDQWEDRSRGACWLPREAFRRHGVDLATLTPGRHDEAYRATLNELIGVAHSHLRNALAYTLLIPSNEVGIRRFCYWAISLAALTLRNIQRKPDFAAGSEVKVSRSKVASTIMLTNLAGRSNLMLAGLFDLATAGLPLTALGNDWHDADTASPAADPELVPALAGGYSGAYPVAAAARESIAPRFRLPPAGAAFIPSISDRAPDTPHEPAHTVIAAERLNATIDAGREALIDLQKPEGDWCFEFEADCTIPAEYILMMHFMDEIDPALQQRLARYLRAQQILGQSGHGGWPQYRGGKLDLSCTVKSYYALKCAGDDPEAPHMRRAREAILACGGAAKSNVFTRILLAMFGQVPWAAAPYVPVEIMLFPRWFPFEIYKVSTWARAVMVPLFVLCSLKAKAKNPQHVHIRELFARPPEQETQWFPNEGGIAKLFNVLDRVGRRVDPLIPKTLRRYAIKRAEAWFTPRLNGVYGLNGIFPAMVNAYEAMALLGYPADHPLRADCLKSLQSLICELPDGSAYAQPTLSPTWDTGWAIMALLNAETPDGSVNERHQAAIQRAIDWLLPRQVLDHVGDWAIAAPKPTPRPGGWAFQDRNPDYPDLDDTAMIAGVLHLAGREPGSNRYATVTNRAADWIVGLQSKNGGFGAYDADNTHHWINSIPFADHKAMLDPPTEDVTGRVLACLGVLKRGQDRDAIRRAVTYLKRTQQNDGCWWGRWGTNYIYGTWSVLAGLALVGEDLQAPYIRKAIAWLESKQNPDGGWGETNDTYIDSALRGMMNDVSGPVSTPNSTAWALLALFAVGEADSEVVRRGIGWLIAHQQTDGKYGGLWHDAGHNAPGFPRVFYMKYYGYDAYFPLWALTRYRQLQATPRNGAPTLE